jgi:hypothetical protein
MVKEKPATLKRENGLATMFIIESHKKKAVAKSKLIILYSPTTA